MKLNQANIQEIHGMLVLAKIEIENLHGKLQNMNNLNLEKENLNKVVKNENMRLKKELMEVKKDFGFYKKENKQIEDESKKLRMNLVIENKNLEHFLSENEFEKQNYKKEVLLLKENLIKIEEEYENKMEIQKNNLNDKFEKDLNKMKFNLEELFKISVENKISEINVK